jgi:hypothetical protein
LAADIAEFRPITAHVDRPVDKPNLFDVFVGYRLWLAIWRSLPAEYRPDPGHHGSTHVGLTWVFSELRVGTHETACGPGTADDTCGSPGARRSYYGRRDLVVFNAGPGVHRGIVKALNDFNWTITATSAW